MRKTFLAILCLLTLASPALAQWWGQGFQPDPPVQSDPNAPYILLGPYTYSGKGAPLNQYRLFNPVSPLSLTDNGATGLLDLNLGTVPINKGGTNATTQQGAVNNVLGFTSIATGDLTYYNGTNWVRLPIGSPNQILTVSGGLPTWSTAAAAAPAAATILTLNNESATMPNSRRIAVSSDLSATDAGAGSTLTLGVSSNVVVLTGAQSITGQKTLTNPRIAWNAGGGFGLSGTSFTSQLKYADWPAARNLTIPDPGADANFVMTEGAQTVNGVKTFGSAPRLSTNTLTSSTGNAITFPNAADTVVLLTQSQNVTNKTLTSPIIANAGTAMTFAQTTANYSVTVANPSGARAYNIYDANGNGDFAIKSGTPTAGGAAYGDGNLIRFTSAGSSGSPLVSQGASAPIFQTLGISGGGTNNASLGVSAVGIYAGDGSKLVQVTGSANQQFRVNAGGTAIEAFTPASSGTVTSFSAGTLSPLFTTSVATATTTPALSFALSNAGAYTVLGNNTSGSAAPAYQTMVTQQLPQQALTFGGNGGTTGLRPLLTPPAAPTVSPQGTTGATTYTYCIIALEDAGASTTSTNRCDNYYGAPTTIANGNATLSASNFNRITWTAVPGAAAYVIYRSTGPNAPGAVASVLAGTTTYDDISNTLGGTTLVGFADLGSAPSAFGAMLLYGDHYHVGNYTNNATTVCNACRIRVAGTYTQGASVIVNAEAAGGAGASNASGTSGDGQGYGGGNGTTTGGSGCYGGGGGGFGGNGGNGGGSVAAADRGGKGGLSHTMTEALRGSGGAGGASASGNSGGAGGTGGGGLYIEATSITINASITANGTAGAASPAASTAGGGGGSGGGIDLRATGNVTISAAATLSCAGGAGGNGGTSGAAGGGGGGGYIFIHGGSVTTTGATFTVSGGAAGGGTSPQAATAGSSGVVIVENHVIPPRLY